MADSIFISFEVGTNPEDYDQQFSLPAEIDLLHAFAGADFPAAPVYCEDIADVLA